MHVHCGRQQVRALCFDPMAVLAGWGGGGGGGQWGRGEVWLGGGGGGGALGAERPRLKGQEAMEGEGTGGLGWWWGETDGHRKGSSEGTNGGGARAH